MSNHVTNMHTVRTILQLLERGVSERHVSKQLHVSRKTVRKYASCFSRCSSSFAELSALDDASLAAVVYPPLPIVVKDSGSRRDHFDSLAEYFVGELKRTGVTRYLLWQEYTKQYGKGYGYSQFCDLLLRHCKLTNLSMHFEHEPAQTMMIDFAGDKLFYTDSSSGEVIYCPVLVCVLPFSGYSYVRALHNASLPWLVKALNGCVEYFGGSARTMLCDNMKQIVYRSCRYEPVFTDMISSWALHYNIILSAARVGKPKDKASVENEVKLSYQRIYAPLRDQVFFSLEELNAAVSVQLKAHHARQMQNRDYSREQLFSLHEKPLLQPLASTAFILKHRCQSKVQRNYHVIVGEDWHYYSVPCAYVGKTMQLVYDGDTVEVYHLHDRIALHRRSYKKHGYTTLKEHMPQAHQKVYEQKGWNEEYFLAQAGKIGVHTQQFIDRLLQSRHFTQQSYNACLGILRLARTYDPGRMEAACIRALQGNSYSYRIIYNILSAGLDKEQLPFGQGNLFQSPEHDNLRGSEAYG